MFINFTFNNISNNSYGIQCCEFGSNSGVSTVSDGSETELNTDKAPIGFKWYIYDTNYIEPLKFNIQILNSDNSDMTTDKRRAVIKWLCLNNEYKWLSIDHEGYFDINFNVIITNPKVIKIGKAVGMEFTVTCDSPFGYSNPIRKHFNITSSNQLITIHNHSDEQDCLYPLMKITMNSNGNLQIINQYEIEHYDFLIEQMSNGEVVTLNNELGIIETTNNSSKNILSKFNKHWFRLLQGENKFIVNGNCNIELEYREIRKVGVEL